MNREEFLDKLSNSSAEIIDIDGKSHRGRDLFAQASAKKNSDIKLVNTDRGEVLLVEYLAAVLGGGCIVTGPRIPDNIPQGSNWVSYTSGSTGEPKAIAHPFEHFISPSVAMYNTHGVKDLDTFFNIMPTNIGVCLTLGTFPLLLAGGRVIFEKFNPFTTPAKMTASKLTMMTLPPGAYAVLSRQKEWSNVSLERGRFILSGSNFVRPGYFEDVKSKGGIPLNGYGTTEVPGNCTAYPHPDYLGKNWYPGIQYKVMEDGQLAIKWDNQPDFWISGDLVEEDPVHGIKIIGRLNNMFKYLDRKVYPEVYENHVKNKMPGITECILKLEDDKIALLYEGTANDKDIRDELGQIIPKEMLPKRIQQVVGLPRTALGKLVRS